jgi:hypothetical protein
MDNILSAVEYHKARHRNATDKTATFPPPSPRAEYAAEGGNFDGQRL